MYKATIKFRDKRNRAKVYQIGETFSCDDEERIKDLIGRGLIEEVANGTSDEPELEPVTEEKPKPDAPKPEPVVEEKPKTRRSGTKDTEAK